MAYVISLDPPFFKPTDSESNSQSDTLIEFREPFDGNYQILIKLWRMVLEMAIRDGATSIHYYPGYASCKLTYVVEGIRYELIPPPDFLDDPIVRTVQLRFSCSYINRFRLWFQMLMSRSFTRDLVVFTLYDFTYLFQIITKQYQGWWSVDMYRISPVVPVPPEFSASTPEAVAISEDHAPAVPSGDPDMDAGRGVAARMQ